MLAREGHPDPVWYEVPKSRKAPKRVRRALARDAGIVFVWGGDGMDTGSVNGEHFAVMAGAGFDARMISGTSRKMKAKFGRADYLYCGARNLAGGRARAVIAVDGQRFSAAGSPASWWGTRHDPRRG